MPTQCLRFVGNVTAADVIAAIKAVVWWQVGLAIVACETTDEIRVRIVRVCHVQNVANFSHALDAA